jgi:hypothetical protein
MRMIFRIGPLRGAGVTAMTARPHGPDAGGLHNDGALGRRRISVLAEATGGPDGNGAEFCPLRALCALGTSRGPISDLLRLVSSCEKKGAPWPAAQNRKLQTLEDGPFEKRSTK